MQYKTYCQLLKINQEFVRISGQGKYYQLRFSYYYSIKETAL